MAGAPQEPRTRMVDCPACNGEGFHLELGSIDREVGGFIEHRYRCTECDGAGGVEIELETITLDDLDELAAEEAA